jgi:hypothetical protein
MLSSGGRNTSSRILKFISAVCLLVVALALPGCQPDPCPPMLLNIIDRESWGAAEPDIAGSDEGFYDPVFNPGGWYTYTVPLREALNTFIIHHSATLQDNTPAAIQSGHMNGEGYADIAYQFIIDKAGLIYEGRDIRVRGAHTGGHNTGTVGIVLSGNFEIEEPTTEQLCSLKRLAIQLKTQYDITHLAGHRDFQPNETVCPGENLAEELPGIAAELRLEYGTGGYVGVP